VSPLATEEVDAGHSCPVCRTSMEGMRRHAKTCRKASCRKAWSRRQARERRELEEEHARRLSWRGDADLALACHCEPGLYRMDSEEMRCLKCGKWPSLGDVPAEPTPSWRRRWERAESLGMARPWLDLEGDLQPLVRRRLTGEEYRTSYQADPHHVRAVVPKHERQSPDT
jgi:hypothetical protein